MSVDDPNVVDAIGTERDTGVVVLTIFDQLDWDDDQHFVALQEKINRYLGFIESGEVLESYPQAAGRPLRIEVVCKCSPSKDGEQALIAARGVWLLVSVACGLI